MEHPSNRIKGSDTHRHHFVERMARTPIPTIKLFIHFYCIHVCVCFRDSWDWDLEGLEYRVSVSRKTSIPEEASGHRMPSGTHMAHLAHMTHSVIIGPLPVPGSAGDSHSSRPPIDASPALHLGSRKTKGGFRAGRPERQAARRPASIGRHPGKLVKRRRGLQQAGRQLRGHVAEALVVGPHQLAHLHRAAGSQRTGVEPLTLTQEQVELVKNRLLLLAPEPLPVGGQAQERGIAGDDVVGRVQCGRALLDLTDPLEHSRFEPLGTPGLPRSRQERVRLSYSSRNQR